MFRVLSKKDEAKFRKWARDNYVPFTPIDALWHPVVREECDAINEEILENVSP